MLFKACGIRSVDDLHDEHLQLVDLFGINFSPISKRRPKPENIAPLLKKIPSEKQVFVFKENNTSEIEEITEKYKPAYIQVYSNEKLKLRHPVKKILAINFITGQEKLNYRILEKYEFLILEGAKSGIGEGISANVRLDLIKYPFLLAGGINVRNLSKANRYSNCIGVDIASGIENRAKVSPKKINEILLQMGRMEEKVF